MNLCRDRKWISYVVTAIAGLIIVINILPYLYATRFVVQAADDLRAGPASGKGYFSYALQNMVNIYKGWQGTFVSEFFVYFFSPLTRFGVEGIRWFCFTVILFFYFSLWINVYCIMKHIFGISEKYKIVIAYALVSMMVSNAHSPSELFFWYTGCCAYTFSFCFLLIGVGVLIRYMYTPQNRYWILAMICAFVSSGSVLQFSALICYFYLAIAIWAKVTKYPQWRKVWAAFGAALVTALVNVCAPGNYVRHDVIDESNFIIFKAMRFSFSVVGWEIIDLLRQTDFLLVIVCFIIMGVVVYRNQAGVTIKFRYLCYLLIGLIGAMWISTYPVVLGYSKAALQDRGYFILDIIAVLSALAGSMMFGKYLAQFLKNLSDKYMYLAIGMAALILIGGYAFFGSKIDRPAAQCIREVRSGVFEQFRDTWEYVYRQIEESEESTVVVQVNNIPRSDILMNPNISSDASYWINGMVRTYYGKEAVSVQSME